ncbi:hypothetical protein AUQ37_03380 [Candidatus Methanomethylophilus sp. 1R26]|uniref:glycosyltransferase 87 family protein n=1 Tax=Candidatus Methanomethylophilus sp. 1R26 TaxID=1769296 RepID=UPI0007364988|nr:glycosyltransferase 87 family protein [Candidatus Methanomethylophilus sp. 1R26]KUE73150.1 hypothetical protein AUQ37_03380 [Candidatus Methanomethylophilus sp. 1R26]
MPQLRRIEDRYLICISAVVFLVLFAAFGFLSKHPTVDVRDYYMYVRLMDDGQVPYLDFNPGYPPVSMLILSVPYLLSSDFSGYCVAFAAMTTVFFFLTGLVLIRTLRNCGIGRTAPVILYLIISAMFFSRGIWRFDIAVCLLTALSLMLFLEKHYFSATAIAFIGALTKIAPILLVAVFLIYAVKNRECRKPVLGCTVLFAAATSVAVGALALAGCDMSAVFSFLNSNMSRGFHKESTVALIAMIADALGGPAAHFEYANSTLNVVSPLIDGLSGVWPYVTACVMCIALAAVAYAIVRSGRPSDARSAAEDLCPSVLLLTVVLLLIFNVFSTSFILWLFALIPLCAALSDGRGFRMIAVSSVLMVWLSIAFLADGNYAVLLLRDICLAAIAVTASKSLFDRERIGRCGGRGCTVKQRKA